MKTFAKFVPCCVLSVFLQTLPVLAQGHIYFDDSELARLSRTEGEALPEALHDAFEERIYAYTQEASRSFVGKRTCAVVMVTLVSPTGIQYVIGVSSENTQLAEYYAQSFCQFSRPQYTMNGTLNQDQCVTYPTSSVIFPPRNDLHYCDATGVITNLGQKSGQFRFHRLSFNDSEYVDLVRREAARPGF